MDARRDPRRLLFVCIENSCRSQMAEAFARMHGRGVEAHSAGSSPSGRVNETAVRVMEERGYDLSSHRSKALTEVPDGPYEAVVSMGCGDACPWVPASRRLEWEIPDPAQLPLSEFRAVRDRIEVQVRELLASLGDSAGPDPTG